MNANGEVEVTRSQVIAAMGEATLGEVSGRYLAAGTWVDVTNPADFGDMVEDLTIPLGDDWAIVVASSLDSFDLQEPPITSTLWKTCFQQLNAFTDEGRKLRGQRESVRSANLNAYSKYMLPRYVWVTLFKAEGKPGEPRYLSPLPVYNGPLDHVGCVELPPGQYTGWTFHRVQKDSTVARIYDHIRPTTETPFPFKPLDFPSLPADQYPRGQAVRFTVPNGIPKSPVTLIPDKAAQVALVYGEAFYRQDNGVLPNETYTAYANERCPPYKGERTEACHSVRTIEDTDVNGQKITYPVGAVYLGPNKGNGQSGDLNSSSHNSDQKYVIAHEMGHQVQHRLMGDWQRDYDLRAGLSVPALCDCDGLNPTGNEIHCLQSTEQQGTAQLEGYGQFFAGHVWNERTDSECVFTYYKNFRRPDGQIDYAPSAKSCTDVVRWAETYCPMTNRGTEYDWMGFYTNLGRQPTGAITQSELASVYARNCNGSPSTRCVYGQSVAWSGLLGAARTQFGPTSARTLSFERLGDAHGITR